MTTHITLHLTTDAPTAEVLEDLGRTFRPSRVVGSDPTYAIDRVEVHVPIDAHIVDEETTTVTTDVEVDLSTDPDDDEDDQ